MPPKKCYTKCKPSTIEIVREIPLENKITRQTIDKKTGITIEEQLLDYCKEPRTINEIRERFNITTNYRVNKSFTKPLIDQGKLQYTIPEDVDNLHQMYLTVGIERTPEIEEIIKQKSITKESAEYKQKILTFCKVPRGIREIEKHIQSKTTTLYVRELVEDGKIKLTHPDIPSYCKQRYFNASEQCEQFADDAVAEYCKEPRTKFEIEQYFDITKAMRKGVVQRLLDNGKICYTKESEKLGKFDGNRRLVKNG